jgi:tetratricopeptide (TPR) repeat protein
MKNGAADDGENLDHKIEDLNGVMKKGYTTEHVQELVRLYLANGEYENALAWLRNVTSWTADMCLCRLYTFAKVVPNSIHQTLRLAKNLYVHPTPESIFYMASLYFDAEQYSQAFVEVGKCRIEHMGIFEYQFKLLTFELMWKQERVHSWIFLMADGNENGHTMYLRGLHFMRICEYERAIIVLERCIIDTFGTYSLKNTYAAYNALLKCYENYDMEFPITDADPDARFRLCAHCHVQIDRKPLLEMDTDFLICSQCKRIAFCSEKCNDDHWAVHKEECGKRIDSNHRIDFTCSKSCAYCFRRNPEKQCTRCKSAQYCGPECQKKHWKSHKETCNK